MKTSLSACARQSLGVAARSIAGCCLTALFNPPLRRRSEKSEKVEKSERLEIVEKSEKTEKVEISRKSNCMLDRIRQAAVYAKTMTKRLPGFPSLPPRSSSADVALLPVRQPGSSLLSSWPKRAGGFFLAVGVLLILTSCAAYKSTLSTTTIYDLGEPTERVEKTVLRSLGVKTAFVSVAKDEQSSRFEQDAGGAFDMRTGGTSEVFDGVTGPVESLRIGKDAAVELAPFIAQYMAARRAADLAAGAIADRIVTPTPTPIPSDTLAPLNLAPGTEALEAAP